MPANFMLKGALLLRHGSTAIIASSTHGGVHLLDVQVELFFKLFRGGGGQLEHSLGLKTTM
jgi:hypothetical protein